MPINPWEALGYAIRSAHQFIGTSIKGAAVSIDASVDDLDTRAVYTLYARRESILGTRTYTITREATEFSEQVYWLPWGQNPMVTIKFLNDSNANFFLTSSFSGCYFIGCNDIVMHTAAGYKNAPVDNALLELQEWHEDMGIEENDDGSRFILSSARVTANQPDHRATSIYGSADSVPRAIVMGYRSPLPNQGWLFAYQDMTIGTLEHTKWRTLR